MEVLPHETVYQFQEAAVPKVPPVALSVTEAPGHCAVAGVAVAVVAEKELAYKVTVTLTHGVAAAQGGGF